jgi:hypothetical protein
MMMENVTASVAVAVHNWPFSLAVKAGLFPVGTTANSMTTGLSELIPSGMDGRRVIQFRFQIGDQRLPRFGGRLCHPGGGTDSFSHKPVSSRTFAVLAASSWRPVQYC